MAELAWPAALPPQTMIWSIVKAGTQFRSPFAGSVETVTFPGWFWRVSVTLKPRRARDGGPVEGFFEGIAGGDDYVLVYHWLRPVPRGTMRGSPVLSAAAVRGDRVLHITTPGNLRTGDLLKCGTTVFKASADCDPVSGTLTVPLVGRVRAPLALGAAVIWDRPTIRCIVPALQHSTSYRPGAMLGPAIELEEA